MGPAETEERIARLVETYKTATFPALTSEARNAKADAQISAQAQLVSLAGEILGAVFSIASSLEELAQCVRYDHPAAGGRARFATEDHNG